MKPDFGMANHRRGADDIAPERIARLWCFDFDNTLAALERVVDWAASRRELEAYLRREGVDDQIFLDFPKGNLLLYDSLRGRLMTAPASANKSSDGDGARFSNDAGRLLRRASEIIETYELRGAERAAPLAGALELLRALAACNFAVAIVTSNSSRTVRRWLERHRVMSCVAAIVGRDSALPLKPSSAMVTRALNLHATAAGDAVFVGDSLADAEAARAAGVRFLGIAAEPAGRERLTAAGAEAVFESPGALAAAMKLE